MKDNQIELRNVLRKKIKTCIKESPYGRLMSNEAFLQRKVGKNKLREVSLRANCSHLFVFSSTKIILPSSWDVINMCIGKVNL